MTEIWAYRSDIEIPTADLVGFDVEANDGHKLIDCLIEAVAVRVGAEILHADTDFEVLARYTDVRVHHGSLR